MAFRAFRVNEDEIWAAETFDEAVAAAKKHVDLADHDSFETEETGNVVPLDSIVKVEEEDLRFTIAELIDESSGPHLVCTSA